ncbi:hypothetical protein [Methylomonas albis]|uniref:Uncharacterized protein n=1 Tax=Methylomonas albis TaxID=1854563 RepID=A0ABR9CVR1_9GAMM|nr:hypothetical protein [Methylomonas albis]MBD9354536.1 hypothetical protein [Methylomonas albis]CAD6877424.1 hypothetical protein [Methylomonas albis]
MIRDGKRYVQRLGSFDDSIGQSGGLLDVFDDTTGKLITTIKVYENSRNPDIEGDVQDIFFESMEFDGTGNLVITDEVGRRFLVDTNKLNSVPMP